MSGVDIDASAARFRPPSDPSRTGARDRPRPTRRSALMSPFAIGGSLPSDDRHGDTSVSVPSSGQLTRMVVLQRLARSSALSRRSTIVQVSSHVPSASTSTMPMSGRDPAAGLASVPSCDCAEPSGRHPRRPRRCCRRYAASRCAGDGDGHRWRRAGADVAGWYPAGIPPWQLSVVGIVQRVGPRSRALVNVERPIGPGVVPP